MQLTQGGTTTAHVAVAVPVQPPLFETFAVATYVPTPCPGVQLKGHDVAFAACVWSKSVPPPVFTMRRLAAVNVPCPDTLTATLLEPRSRFGGEAAGVSETVPLNAQVTGHERPARS